MKKLLFFAVLLLSGCVSDLTKYPHYNVPAPAEKARLYIPDEYARDSKPVKKVMREYFLPASSKQNADFIVTHEKTTDLGIGTTAYFFSALTFWILPTWETEEGRLSFSLTEVDSGRKIDLSDVNIKERYYFSWLLSPMLFSSDVYFMDDYASYRAVANAIEEAASLVYDKNSKIYQTTTQKKWGVPSVSPAVEKAPASVPVKEPNPEEMDMLW